jgi:2-C-methyl-D-erythritol 2,4-cyclodiphosphate synthase
MNQRIGLGHDVHPFAEGRKLLLAGVEIPYEKGLLGHSDADVLVHAVCDAILGALGEGDIGAHFPDSDPQYKDISSMALLQKVVALMQDAGYKVNNLDVVVQAEEPSLKGYKEQMRFHLAYALAVEEKAVNIKATTHEGLGFVGRKQGIAAMASILLVQE